MPQTTRATVQRSFGAAVERDGFKLHIDVRNGVAHTSQSSPGWRLLPAPSYPPPPHHRTMKHTHFSRRILALTVVSAAALLVACGGGDTPLSPSESFVSRMATETAVAGSLPATTSLAKRASAPAITNNQLFQWAQLQYPELFGTAAPNVIANLPYNGQLFDVREFPGGAYLGISAGRVFGLGPFTNGELKDFGFVQGFSAQVCSRLNCGGSGNPGGGTDTLNGCTPPASETLRTGYRYTAVFKIDVFGSKPSSGEFSIESLVEGSTSFEGQSAIRTSTRTRGTQQGEVVDVASVSFDQIANNGLSRSLGNETVLSLEGSSVTLRTVNTPPLLNTEFTLQLGQSFDETLTFTSTYINLPFPLPPTTNTSTSRITYEARESITVLGRTYNTCRYKSTAAGDDDIYEWYVFGNGFSVRSESRNKAGAVLSRTELRSGSINGIGI